MSLGGKRIKHRAGFTLVELAIVMTIIGLIIGGILKGQELIATSRVNATIAQVQAYQAAVVTFKDKYESLPGDMQNAAARIPDCGDCTPPAADTASDSMVGLPDWGTGGWAAQTGAAGAAALVAGSAAAETVLFWVHLARADFITDVGDGALQGESANWGVTHPRARVGGGFIVGSGDGSLLPGTPEGESGISGLLLFLAASPTQGGVDGLSAGGRQVLTPGVVARIDRKIDDSLAVSGDVRGYGAASCFAAAGNTYDESLSGRDCGLAFVLQR